MMDVLVFTAKIAAMFFWGIICSFFVYGSAKSLSENESRKGKKVVWFFFWMTMMAYGIAISFACTMIFFETFGIKGE